MILHLTLLHSERPKLYTILAFLSAIGLNFKVEFNCQLINKAENKISCMQSKCKRSMQLFLHVYSLKKFCHKLHYSFSTHIRINNNCKAHLYINNHII